METTEFPADLLPPVAPAHWLFYTTGENEGLVFLKDVYIYMYIYNYYYYYFSFFFYCGLLILD